MPRILLYLATNVAVIAVLSITMRLLGFESLLDQHGIDLDLNALLVYAAVIGFSGSFISLAISKWTAKRMTGAHVIESPNNDTEHWLVNTVQRLAKQAGIGMPEVAIYDAPKLNVFATDMNKNNALSSWPDVITIQGKSRPRRWTKLTSSRGGTLANATRQTNKSHVCCVNAYSIPLKVSSREARTAWPALRNVLVTLSASVKESSTNNSLSIPSDLVTYSHPFSTVQCLASYLLIASFELPSTDKHFY